MRGVRRGGPLGIDCLCMAPFPCIFLNGLNNLLHAAKLDRQ